MLTEQPLQILRMLVERGGELVSREEIKKKLWPNDTIVEFDHTINAAIRNLRRALDDSANEPKYLETLARRGYPCVLQPRQRPRPQQPGQRGLRQLQPTLLAPSTGRVRLDHSRRVPTHP